MASPPPKPAISRFKADRYPDTMVHTPASPSTSLGASILPASEGSVLQNAIRRGKLEDDELVGYDSADEDDDPAVRELLNALVRGDLQNAGPIPPTTNGVSVVTKPTSLAGMKAPEFKASQDRELTRDLTRTKDIRSGAEATVNSTWNTERNPSMSGIVERRPPQVNVSPSAINDPPLAQEAPNAPAVNRSSLAFNSMIIESPSFQAPAPVTMNRSAPHSAGPSAATEAQSMPGNIVVSPSYPPTGRPPRPPIVMSAAVRERVSNPKIREPANDELRQEKKVSRFRAERN
jgi:hypothetical protein